MTNPFANIFKPLFFTSAFMLLVAVLLSCILQQPGDFTNERFKKTLTEKLVKDAANQEDPEEKELSEDVVTVFSTEYLVIKFSNMNTRLSGRRSFFLVSQISADIPVPPPKNPAS